MSTAIQTSALPSSHPTLPVKIAVIGDYSIGKSALVHSYVYGHRSLQDHTGVLQSTIGAWYVTKTYDMTQHPTYKAAAAAAAPTAVTSVTLPSTVRLEVWDTAGQERYKSIVPMYIRDADAIIVCIDITYSDLERAKQLKDWLQFIYTYHSQPHGKLGTIAVAVTKCDLAHSDAHVQSVFVGLKLILNEFLMAKSLTCACNIYTTSAVLGQQVTDLFQDVATSTAIHKALRSVRRSHSTSQATTATTSSSNSSSASMLSRIIRSAIHERDQC
jgi:small GTP-binding protein